MMNLYVDKNGNDANSGTASAPFASIEGCKTAIRKIIASGLTEPITIHIAAGNYHISSLCFDASDSGTLDCPITYTAEGAVTLNGGIRLEPSQFVPVSDEVRACLHDDSKDKVVCIDLTTLGLNADDWGNMCVIGSHNSGFLYEDAVLSPLWCELFVNDQRQTIARYPNDGFLKFGEPIYEGDGWGSGFGTGTKHEHDEWVTLRNPSADIYGIDPNTAKRAAAWKYADDLWMFGFPMHDWADMSTPIVKIDAVKCSMEAKYVSMFGIKDGSKQDDYHNGGTYYLYNVLDELDAPGEWYLDRKTGMLYLYPPCDMKTADINLSLITDSVLCFDGAAHMTFHGFTIQGTRANGISGTGESITIDSCLIKNVAEHAVSLAGSRNLVKNCEITHTGKGGIYLSGGDRQTLTPGENIAENNYIHDFSEIYQTYQAGIYLSGVGNIARHNEICNTPHMALGYSGNDHLIEYNDIHDAVYRSTDAGAIYAGFDWAANGTVIRYNRLSNIGNENYHPNGVYWDDGLSGQTAYGNILINIGNDSFAVGGGRDCVVEGNIIIGSGTSALEYDDRNRDGHVNHGWAWRATEYPNGKHWNILSQVPFRSEIWAKKYPHLAALKTDPNTDFDDPDFPINPTYSSLQHNVVIAPRGELYAVADSVRRYSTVDDNHLYQTKEDAGWDDATGNLHENSPVYREIPMFAKIPAEKIGRR